MGRRQVIAFDAPAARSAAASFSAVDREAIGSFNPERISTGTPERSGAGGSVSGAMARMRIAPLSVFGCNSKRPRRCSRRSNSRLRRAERGRKRGAPHRRNWRARPPGRRFPDPELASQRCSSHGGRRSPRVPPFCGWDIGSGEWLGGPQRAPIVPLLDADQPRAGGSKDPTMVKSARAVAMSLPRNLIDGPRLGKSAQAERPRSVSADR